MKNNILLLAILLFTFQTIPAYSQSDKEPKSLDLPGDNFDLYAVMEIFQKSKTIEDFEKAINDEKESVNNLDLDNDGKVDYLKVVSEKDGDAFTFIIQDPVSKTEVQDIAVILVSKDSKDNISIQIVGDELMYGKDYVIEPKPKNTSNPAFSDSQTVVKTTAPTTVIVEQAPIVQYIYSPVYVPYYPPYYYGYYPPYYRPWVPIYFGVYWSHHYHCHSHYYGGYRGSVNINIYNSNHYNKYTVNNRNRSTTVSGNISRGSYRGTYNGKTYAKASRSNVAAGRENSRGNSNSRDLNKRNTTTHSERNASTKRGSNETNRATTRSSANPRQSASPNRSSAGSVRGSSTGSGFGGTRGGRR